jgi:predicted enzyme related to lactoylglutathione lyase
MPSTNPVNWFEIPVADMARAKAFYEHVLGIPLAENRLGAMEMAWFPVATGATGATGALMRADGYTPSHDGTLVYFAVEDIEAALARAAEFGGRTLSSKTSIGEHGFIAHLEDPEGNRIALHSLK